MKRSLSGASNRKLRVHRPISLCTSAPGRTPGQVPTPTGMLPAAAGTGISLQGAPPSLKFDAAWVATGRCAAGAEPDPAPAASGITQADSTANTGISTERRIVTHLD